MVSSFQESLNLAISAVKDKNPKNFYFVACGGSNATLQSGAYIMDRESEQPAAGYSSNEFIHRCPKGLGKDSVVILCSHSGNTPETVAATTFAREKGALTIILSHKEDSPLWEAGECRIFYTWGPECTAQETVTGMLYRLVFGILNALQPCDKYRKALDYIENELHNGIERTLAKTKDAAFDFGYRYRRERLIYTMGSGISYWTAYSYAICILQEMQWVNSAAIHSGEYFHGPFEITDYDMPFILLKSVGETRPLDERAHTFLQRFCKEIILLDAKDFDMGDLPAELEGYFCNLYFGKVLRAYAEQLSEQRGHPLSVRRYMWKLEY